MIKSRLALCIWINVVAISLHIFGNDLGTGIVLAISIGVPLFTIGLTGICARRISISIKHPQVCTQDETINIEITASGDWASYTNCQLLCSNLLTGEQHISSIKITPGHRMLDSISFTSANCGMIKLSLINITASDMFSLSSWKIKRAMESEILVMPKPLDIQLTINPRAKAVLDSEEYSMNHPGNDPSETFAIREYIPGDSLKSIHWKLSLKTDTLLVRELGMPVMDKILLLMETALPQGISEINHDQISAVTAALYSISREIDVPHTLGWMDTVSGAYISQEIINHGDLDTAFTQLLANTIKPCGTSTIEAYKSASEGRTPSHIIIAGLYVDAAHVFGLSTVTVISCMEDLLGLEI